MISATKFARFAPRALPGTQAALETAAAAHGLTGLSLAHWLGQIYVESKGFTTLEENLNYSIDGLLATFGRHRISEADARKFGRAPGRPADQSAIANLVYGGEWGRKNLGNTKPGDGWKNRGSGLIQTTGETNVAASGFTAEELRTDINKAALAAAAFFVDRGCVAPAKRDDIKAVTLKINGGYNGLDARVIATNAAKDVVL